MIHQEEKSEGKSRRSFLVPAILLVLLLAFSFSLTKVFDYDVWWHLKAGEHIWKTLQIPRQDFFSITAEGKPWIDVHWLSQALFYAVFFLCGMSGIQLFTAAVVVAAACCILRTRGEEIFLLSVLPLLYLAIYASKDRFLTRPDIFTLLFPVLCFFLLYRFKFDGEKAGGKVYLILLLQLFWVNMHGSFILGPLLILAFFAGELMERLLPASFRPLRIERSDAGLPQDRTFRAGAPLTEGPGKLDDLQHAVNSGPSGKNEKKGSWVFWTEVERKKVIILLVLLLVSLIINLINPYGAKIYSLYQTYVESFGEFASSSRAELPPITIQEWLPTFSETAAKYHHTFFKFYLALALIGLISFLLNIRRFSPALFFVFAGFFFLSIFAIRNVSIFALLCAPVAAHNFFEFFSARSREWATADVRSLKSRVRRLRPVWVVFPLFAALLLVSIYDSFSNGYYLRHNMPMETGFGISRFPFPAGGARFVKEHKLPANMYNNFESGGYLIWELYPGYRVFTDGRYIDPEFDRVHISAATDLRKWQEMADRYQVEFALLKYPASDTAYLIAEISRSDRWKMAYFDSNSVIFLRNSAKNSELIREAGIELPPFAMRKDLHLDELPFAREFPDAKPQEEPPFHTELPDSEIPKDLLAHPLDRLAARFQNDLERLQKRPLPLARLNFAYFLHLTGFLNASAAAYREVLEELPDYLPAHYELSRLYIQLENYPKALQEAEYLLARGAKDFDLLYQAGFSAFQLRRFHKAIPFFLSALSLNEKDYSSLLHLGLSYLKTDHLNEAERYIRMAVEAKPDSAEARYYLGLLLLKKGDRAHAQQELRKAFVLDPTLQEAFALDPSLQER